MQFGTQAIKKADYHKMLEPALCGDGDFVAFSMDVDPDRVLELAQA
jgi:hypothetical protein